MDIMQIMRERHSVRSYTDLPIEKEKREQLNYLAQKCNTESGLHLQIIYDDPAAFNGFMAHYGKFSGVRNYIAVVGKKDCEESCGYYGEKIVLKAQELGLNTCWVALTYSKRKVKIEKDKGEKLYCIIALGYGNGAGNAHKSKPLEEILFVSGEKPEWLDRGTEAALLAPTAVNQQKFAIICNNGKVSIVKSGRGFYTDLDLGIVKCHFELATGIQV